MKKFLTSLFIITFALISCKNEAETKENTIPKVVVPFTQVAIPQENQTVSTPQPNQNQSIMSQSSGNQVQTVAAPVVVAKGMNPSHGQPGHRCDIPVGSPLNAPLSNNNNNNQQVISNSSVTVPSATMTKTPKGMNPAHGQPKHRCDIPVGAPLNSPIATNKPATPPVTSNYNVTVPSPTATTTQTPVTPATSTPEGMNPPHGQEKHRCDVAVGAPLPKE